DFSRYAGIVWAVFACNTLVPQVLWLRPLRRNSAVLLAVCGAVLVGMWLERFMIIASSLSSDFLPSSVGIFPPPLSDILTSAGSIGFFLACFLLFIPFLPVMSMCEMRAMLPNSRGPEVGR